MRKRAENASEKNRFTRMCIGEAMLSLLEEKALEKITVSDITRKAGISRMTYYRYYDSRTEVLQDYLEEIISEYLRENAKRPVEERFHTYAHILFSLEFFDRYADFFLTMTRAGLYSIMIEAINQFMEEQIFSRNPNAKYERFYYAGALLNTFIKWEEDGQRASAEEVARMISTFVS